MGQRRTWTSSTYLKYSWQPKHDIIMGNVNYAEQEKSNQKNLSNKLNVKE